MENIKVCEMKIKYSYELEYKLYRKNLNADISLKMLGKKIVNGVL